MISDANENPDQQPIFQIFDNLDIGYNVLIHNPINNYNDLVNPEEMIRGTIIQAVLLVDDNNDYYLLIKKIYNNIDLIILAQSIGATNLQLVPAVLKQNILNASNEETSLLSIFHDVGNLVNIVIDTQIPNDYVNFSTMRNYQTMTLAYNDLITFITSFGKNIIYY